MVLAHNISEGQRTKDIQISQNVTFDSMLLTSYTLQGLKNSGFYKPSPVQLLGIPLGKCGFDLLLEAKSGTGKTAVFTIIALEKLDLSKGLQAVILAPTREIAAQICDVIKQIGSFYEGLEVEVVMGGLPVQDDIAKFKNKKVHILVGSPGRLRHMIQDKYINVCTVRLVVLDEADKLMEKSFLPDINYIFSALPKQKQVILSSATYPDITKSFIDHYVQDAQHICPDINNVLLGVEQKVTIVTHNNHIVKQTNHRFEELLKILSKKPFKQCLIFCNYQARVAELHKLLRRHKWPAVPLYGQQEQIDRLNALKTLQEYKCRILIATDLAARGIDASNVDLVINFELPHEWQTYLHRIGRAGRFGSYGMAISILSEGKEVNKFNGLLSLLNVPVIIKEFWGDEKFNMDDLNTTSTTTNEDTSSQSSEIIEEAVQKEEENGNEKQFEELWSILTQESKNNNSDEVESFENLCDSFKKFGDSGIKTFAELMDSFQSSQEITANGTQSECKISKVPILPQEYFTSTRNICEASNKFSEATDKTLHVHKRDTYGKLQNNVDNQKTTNILGDLGNDEINSYEDKYTYKDTEDSMLINGNNNYVDEYFEDTSMNEVMIAAGLPTSFSSSKTKYNRLKKNKVKTLQQPLRDASNCDLDSVCFELNHDVQLDGIPKQNLNSKNKQNNSMKSLVKPVNSEQSLETIAQNQRSKHGNSLINKPINSKNEAMVSSETKHNKLSRKQTRKRSNMQELTQNYVNWYNRLKYVTKQIELSTYIDELSKLTTK